MKRKRNALLLIGGLFSAAVAVLHAVVIFLGAPAYRYFDAPGLAAKAAAGSAVPGILMALLALVFGVFSVYGLAGARVLPKLPKMRFALLVISGAYLLRGLPLLPGLMAVMAAPDTTPTRPLGIAGLSLLVGVFHAIGTGESWEQFHGPSHRRVKKPRR